jgi:hypothetical protein
MGGDVLLIAAARKCDMAKRIVKLLIEWNPYNNPEARTNVNRSELLKPLKQVEKIRILHANGNTGLHKGRHFSGEDKAKVVVQTLLEHNAKTNTLLGAP